MKTPADCRRFLVFISERDDLLVQIVYCYIHIVVALSLLRDLSEVDSLLRAVLDARAAGYALVAEYDSLTGIFDIVHRADLCACSAHDALVVCLQGLTLHAGYHWPSRVLSLVPVSLRYSPLGLHIVFDIIREFLREVFRPCLCLNGSHLRHHEVVREEPDACALMWNGRPIIERDYLVEFSEALALVCRALVDRECIGIRIDLDIIQISLHMSRESAAVAREDESYPLGSSYVSDSRILTHHDDVGIAQALRYVLCHIKAIART